MAGDVHDLAEERRSRTPHLSGPARCLACRHEWQAVVQDSRDGVGVWLECPVCTLMQGRFIGSIQRGCEMWVCTCGNDLFHVDREGAYCPVCGRYGKPGDADPPTGS